jgi:nicotinic acid phosphoribosyltransferase
MGFLLPDPLEIESYVLYARCGGPQVVPDLSRILLGIVQAKPSREQVTAAAHFWRSQEIPFPEQAWCQIAQEKTLPLEVRGVQDGEVVYPGDPIAVFTGPAALVACLEPILEGELMTSMQVATRFVKCASALHWDTARIFEVGLRTASNPTDHLEKIRTLRRVGLRFTSHGAAARELSLRAVGTMGHRYTQRFLGEQADYQAFAAALRRMLVFRKEAGIQHPLSLSFLLDTRDTLGKGLPAGLQVLREHASDLISGSLQIHLRLDSGDLLRQLGLTVQELLALEREVPQLQPGVILESGLTAEDIARFEALAGTLGFPRRRISYGLGGYLIGGLHRDTIALVYKLASYGGSLRGAVSRRTPVMKFADAPRGGKESYPGDLDLWERERRGQVRRILALTEERATMQGRGFEPVFAELVRGGVVQEAAIRSDAEVQSRVRKRWTQLTGGYIGEARTYQRPDGREVRRPLYSPGLHSLVEKLRRQQLGKGTPAVPPGPRSAPRERQGSPSEGQGDPSHASPEEG